MNPSDKKHVWKINIRASVQDVWAELTKRGIVQRAMFDTVLESDLKVGSKLAYRTPNGKRTFIVGDVLEADPPRRLVHTFAFIDLPDSPTRVMYELNDLGGSVELVVTHDQFEGETPTFKRVSGGWPSILNNLKCVVEHGQVPFRTRLQYAMMKAMMVFMPLGPYDKQRRSCGGADR